MPTISIFRSDINGLRAWAVVAVVLYHFSVPGFGGGFVGVDVFFVISGLLMTGIVVGGLERGKFSIFGFYMARARRIVPALLALCAVLLSLAWWLLPVADYKALGAQTVASVAFLSNVKFWLEAGYFDVSSHDKWMLHTWSLAVEWQFYLMLPLVLALIWKLRPGRLPIIWAVATMLLVSYALSVALTPMKPTGSFFMLPTRAWEMLAGGLVYLLATRLTLNSLQRRAIEAIGLVLMLGCIAGFDASTAWPGWRAMLPVLASMMVLLVALPSSIWTSNIAAQWLGTRSYSLYLWHWPLVVALRYLDMQGEPLAVFAGLALTALLGHLSYIWVETPARRGIDKLKMVRSAAVLACGTAVVGAMAGVTFLKQGFPGRQPHEVDVISLEASNMNLRRGACHPGTGIASPSCMYGGTQLSAILLGDSHGDAVVSALAVSSPNPSWGVMQWTYSACPTLLGVRNVQIGPNQCAAFIDWAIAELHAVPQNIPLIVVNRHGQYVFGKNEDPAQANIPWVYFSQLYPKSEPEFLKEYAKHLTDTACKLAIDRPVYLVRPIPEMRVNVPSTARGMVWGKHKEVSVSLADYHQRNDFIWAAQDAARDHCDVKILDPLPFLCWDGVCHGSKNGRPMYYDDNHLSEFGNKLLVPMFAKVFEKTTQSSNRK
jgi:peptidoglycan/LPS O-acetylase OafA/YrhL